MYGQYAIQWLEEGRMHYLRTEYLGTAEIVFAMLEHRGVNARVYKGNSLILGKE